MVTVPSGTSSSGVGSCPSGLTVDGVVWYQLRLCETYDMEAHILPERLKKLNPSPPMLKLESEYDIEDIGPMRTRIEAFVESM